ncbi:AraC family transcriptional regulator [Clostridium sp. KNHs205]|jgi:AraC-like DNA-binding protein|uniref:helix-turn-helix domain-containing protein n=1 Tax=Clostridium sp. KNHs205 TaxID=1449050 RepID=UPI00051AC976|nr:AraC family transcriptional regulator [Clostridium sp. KNHs205]
METKQLIIKSLMYIENNLSEPIDLETIAGNMSYSSYHFSRLFKSHIGISVMDYVKQRKLIKASNDILNGAKIIDVAINNGYETHSGFTKSFKNEFGFSPSLLRAVKLQIEYFKGGYAMNHVFMKQTDIHATKEELYEILIQDIKERKLGYSFERIENGYVFACETYEGMKRYSGDEYITHPLNVAIILVEMEVEEDIVIAGLLCDAMLKDNLSEEKIVHQTTDKVKDILMQAKHFNSIDIDDIMMEEVVLLKLAERLHNMRTVEYMDEMERKEKAEETLKLFMPICNKIGDSKLKSELNDLALKYM